MNGILSKQVNDDVRGEIQLVVIPQSRRKHLLEMALVT